MKHSAKHSMKNTQHMNAPKPQQGKPIQPSQSGNAAQDSGNKQSVDWVKRKTGRSPFGAGA